MITALGTSQVDPLPMNVSDLHHDERRVQLVVVGTLVDDGSEQQRTSQEWETKNPLGEAKREAEHQP